MTTLDKRFDRLPEEMRIAMLVLKELHGAPEEITLPTVLSVVNSACQHRYNVDSMKYGVRPISLYLLAMAETGGGKSTIYRELSTELKKFQEQKMTLTQQERQRFEAEEAVYKMRMKKYSKSVLEANGDDMTDYVDVSQLDAPTPPRPIETFNYMPKKATLNGLIEILLSQSFAWISSTEGGEFFSGHSFQGRDNSKAIELTTSLTALWDGDDLDKNTGIVQQRIRGRRVNMFFLLQKAVIQDVLNNRTFQEQGFLNRWLITDAPKYVRPEWLTDAESMQKEDLIRQQLTSFNQRIDHMLSASTQRNGPIWDPYALQLSVIGWDPEAHRLMVDHLFNQCRNGLDRLAHYEGFADRLHEHGIRVAATLAAFKGEENISMETAQAALDIMDFFIEQRANLEIGVRDRDPDQTLGVRRFTEWLRRHHSDLAGQEITRSWVAKRGPGWLRKLGPEQRQSILADCVLNGDLVAEEYRASTGAQVIVYRVPGLDVVANSA